MVIWFVGLSGSGKSTLGREVACRLREVRPNTVLIDGDELRKVFSYDRGDDPYSIRGRRVNAERIVSLCELLDAQGINVICCVLSIFQDIRTDNRHRFSQYFEIFMDASIDALMRRDVKGLYAAATRGEIKNIVGIDIPFERPVGSDMVIDTSNDSPDIRYLADKILERSGIV